MKKTYIKPGNIVITLNVERMVCTSGEFTETEITNSSEIGAREVINTPSAWEEW